MFYFTVEKLFFAEATETNIVTKILTAMNKLGKDLCLLFSLRYFTNFSGLTGS